MNNQHKSVGVPSIIAKANKGQSTKIAKQPLATSASRTVRSSAEPRGAAGSLALLPASFPPKENRLSLWNSDFVLLRPLSFYIKFYIKSQHLFLGYHFLVFMIYISYGIFGISQ